MGPLANERHERFCHEVLADPEGKAGRAYEKAGYAARGPSAEAAASRLLKDGKVQQRLDELKAERSGRSGITLDMVVMGLHAEATNPDNPAGPRVTAWGLLGKHVGAFEKDNEQKGPREVVIRYIDSITDE